MTAKNPDPRNTRTEWTLGAALLVAIVILLIGGWSAGDIIYGLINRPLWRPIALLAVWGIATHGLRRLAIFLVYDLVSSPEEAVAKS